MSYTHHCEQCGRPFESRRPDAATCSEECKTQRWIENGLVGGSQPVKRPLTQKDRVLFELRQAGSAGVRSDRFFKLNMPRAGARVHELKAEGHEITSESEQQFCRYTLVGISAGPSSGPLPSTTSGEVTDDEPAIAMAPPTPSVPARPSFLDPDVEWGSAA